MKPKTSKLSADDLAAARAALRLHDKDAGSAPAQIVRLTERIAQITAHLAAHRNDKHSRRGLIGLVNMRRRLLRYLKRTDAEKHAKTLAMLGLRK